MIKNSNKKKKLNVCQNTSTNFWSYKFNPAKNNNMRCVANLYEIIIILYISINRRKKQLFNFFFVKKNNLTTE